MKKILVSVTLFSMLFVFAAAGLCSPDASVSASTVKAGDTITIEGTIEPGQDLYVAVGQQEMFACKDTEGVYETKRFQKDTKKKGFSLDTEIPPLYYLLTTVPEKFGEVAKKKFGGPSVLLGKGKGLYSTTMFYLKKKFEDVDADAQAMMGPIKTAEQWNFLKYANEGKFGINTIVKDENLIG